MDLMETSELPKVPKLELDEKKLAELVDRGSAYIIMVSTIAWKDLLTKFIEPRKSIDRLFTASRETLGDERAAAKELTLLVSYIDKIIEEGKEAHEELLKRKGR